MPGTRVRRERKLPVQQLTILAICRFAEPIASTSLFPYLPEMVKSFGVPQDQVGKWTGLCSGMFSLSQAVMGIPWGIFADRFGRKPAILLGLSMTMITSLLWGFSTSLTQAVIARALAGGVNGNVGIIRTTVAEMVPFKELQPKAFSIMPLVWTVGSIFGPTFGGLFANPYGVEPGEQLDHPNLLQRFPFALPNIVAACFFTVGITTGILFLEETLETVQGRRDFGLILGRKLSATVRRWGRGVKTALGFGKYNSTNTEREPLIKRNEDEETIVVEAKEPPPPKPSYREVLNRQSVLNLVVYALLALHNMGYDQLLPVYMEHPPMRAHTSLATTSAWSSSNPLKFAGGFGLNHFQVGMIQTCYGICGMFIQFLLFPPIARRYGVLNCLKVCVLAFPVAYFITPFTCLLPTQASQIGCMFAVMMIKCFCSIFAFPLSTILLTNSASSLRVLGTLNGFATSTSAIGRAIGPALGGALFTAGVKAGYVIAPYWAFTALALIAAIPVFWLVEGEGFGGDDDEVSDDDDEEVIEDETDEQAEARLREEAIEGEAEAAGKSGPMLLPTTSQRLHSHAEEEEEEETPYAGFTPFARTRTISSALSLGSDEYSSIGGDDDDDKNTRSREPSWPNAGAGMTIGSGGPSRRSSSRLDAPTPLSRRSSSRRVSRRFSVPVGMGTQGISRRYSSNLGQSLGSAGGFHGGT